MTRDNWLSLLRVLDTGSFFRDSYRSQDKSQNAGFVSVQDVKTL